MEPDDEIGTVRWFGTAWPNPEHPAPVCDPRAHVELPPLSWCAACSVVFQPDDSGIGIPYWPGTAPGEFSYLWWHLACWLRVTRWNSQPMLLPPDLVDDIRSRGGQT